MNDIIIISIIIIIIITIIIIIIIIITTATTAITININIIITITSMDDFGMTTEDTKIEWLGGGGQKNHYALMHAQHILHDFPQDTRQGQTRVRRTIYKKMG